MSAPPCLRRWIGSKYVIRNTLYEIRNIKIQKSKSPKLQHSQKLQYLNYAIYSYKKIIIIFLFLEPPQNTNTLNIFWHFLFSFFVFRFQYSSSILFSIFRFSFCFLSSLQFSRFSYPPKQLNACVTAVLTRFVDRCLHAEGRQRDGRWLKFMRACVCSYWAGNNKWHTC